MDVTEGRPRPWRRCPRPTRPTSSRRFGHYLEPTLPSRRRPRQRYRRGRVSLEQHYPFQARSRGGTAGRGSIEEVHGSLEDMGGHRAWPSAVLTCSSGRRMFSRREGAATGASRGMGRVGSEGVWEGMDWPSRLQRISVGVVLRVEVSCIFARAGRQLIGILYSTFRH